jgi:radical SAM protein with 4Fe4S-binding SPASM domain
MAEVSDAAVLLEGDFRGYNLVGYQNQVYALPLTLGPISVEREPDRQRPGILVGTDLNAVKEEVRLQGKLGILRVDLADNCNIRCIMCQLYNTRPIRHVQFLDFDMFRRQTTGFLKKWSTINLGNVAESTIHPRFGDYLRYIRDETDATICILTNGKLLGRYANLINEIGNCLIHISVDSIQKETHEYIRDGSNYDALLRNFDLIDIKKTQVMLVFTLMNSNIGEYESMVEFCKVRGFQIAAFPMILRDEEGIIPWRLLKESLWFNIDGLRYWLQHHYGKDYGLVHRGTATGAIGPQLDAFSCNAHETDLTMFANGNAILCGKEWLGTLESQSLEEMWRSAAARQFRQEVDRDRAPCMSCDYREGCLSPSMFLMRNHFNERIMTALPADIKNAIAFDRQISNEEALDLFIRNLSDDLTVFDIEGSAVSYTARQILSIHERGGPIAAGTQPDLYKRLTAETNSSRRVELVETGYKGYNLVRYRRAYWGLPQALGVISINQERDRAKPGIIQAPDLESLKQIIDATVVEPARFIEACGAYNLGSYQGQFWAIPRALGETRLEDEQHRQRPGIIHANNLATLKQLIPDTNVAEEPALFIETYGAYNLKRYQGQFWAIPGALGEMRLEEEQHRQRPGIIHANDLATLKRLISDTTVRFEPPQFIETYGAYNLGSYQGQFWAIPGALGKTRLEDEQHRQRPGIIHADDLATLKRLIPETTFAEAERFKPPQFIETYGAYNLGSYRGQFWAIPGALGETRLEDEQHRQRPGIIQANDLATLKQLIPDTTVAEASSMPTILRHLKRLIPTSL